MRLERAAGKRPATLGSRMRRTSGNQMVGRPVAGWGRSAKITVETASETRSSGSLVLPLWPSSDWSVMRHLLQVQPTLTPT